MAEKEQVSLIFKGQDELSEPADLAAQSLEDLARQSNEAALELKKLQAQEKLISKFQDLKGALAASETAMIDTAAALNKLELEASQAERPTQELATALERAKLEASAADKAFKANTNAMAKMGAQVTATGADVNKLDKAEAQLKAETAALTQKQTKLKAALSKAGLEARAQNKDVKSLKDSYGELASKATVMGAAIVGAFVGLKSFLGSAGNAEYATQKLSDTLQRTTGASDAQVAAVNAQADALQNLTRFTNEEIKAGQTKLAEQKLSAQQVMQLTPLLLDMAEAKRESGDADADTIGSAEAIGDAVRNNISALESYGVHITEATEEQFKNATMAERQIMVMDALSSTFEGAAVAAGDTWAGAVDKAANKTQDALEVTAGFITNNKAVKKLLGDVAQAFSDMAQSLASEAPLINKVISTITTQFGWLLDSARLVGNGLQGVWISLKIAILSLSATIVESWASINDALGRNDAAESARELAKVINDDLSSSYKDLANNGEDVKNTFITMSERGGDLYDVLTGVENQTDKTKDAIGGLSKKTKELEENTGDMATTLAEAYAGLGLSYDKLASGLDGNTQKAVDGFTAIINEVTKTYTSAEDLNRILGPAFQKTLEAIDTPEGFKLLEQQINKAAKESEGLAGVILGTLTPAMDTHAETLQAQGIYVDDVNGRYARLAEILGLEMVNGYYKNTAAATENAAAVTSAAANAEAAAKRTNEAVSETAEVASAKGGGIAAFFNAASSMVAELGENATAQFNQSMGIDAPTGLDYLEQKAQQAFESIERSMGNVTTNGLQKFLKNTAIAARQVEADFYKQSASVERLSQSLNETATPTARLIKNAETAMNTMNLLDDSTLSGLRSQIESARSALVSLEDSAQQTLDSISQQLANAKGEYSIAVESQFDTQIKELEAKIENAEAFGSKQALGDLQQALRELKELQRIEIDKAKGREKSERESKSNQKENQKISQQKQKIEINIGNQKINAEADDTEIARLKRFSSIT